MKIFWSLRTGFGWAQPGIYWGWSLGIRAIWQRHSSATHKRKTPQGKIWEFSLVLDALETTFWMVILSYYRYNLVTLFKINAVFSTHSPNLLYSFFVKAMGKKLDWNAFFSTKWAELQTSINGVLHKIYEKKFIFLKTRSRVTLLKIYSF